LFGRRMRLTTWSSRASSGAAWAEVHRGRGQQAPAGRWHPRCLGADPAGHLCHPHSQAGDQPEGAAGRPGCQSLDRGRLRRPGPANLCRDGSGPSRTEREVIHSSGPGGDSRRPAVELGHPSPGGANRTRSLASGCRRVTVTGNRAEPRRSGLRPSRRGVVTSTEHSDAARLRLRRRRRSPCCSPSQPTTIPILGSRSTHRHIS
jgi:hypothetical protein